MNMEHETQEQPKPKTSSMMHEPRYDPDTQTLTIQFTNGVTYDYPNFSEEKFKEFHEAPSWGKYFGANRALFANGVKQVSEDEVARAS
jgi:KTSC domain